jgi:hypothetical protein
MVDVMNTFMTGIFTLVGALGGIVLGFCLMNVHQIKKKKDK